MSSSVCHLPRFRVRLLPQQEKLAALLLRYAHESGLVPFSTGKLYKCNENEHLSTFGMSEIQRILDRLHAEGKLVRFNDRRYLTPRAVEEIKKRIRKRVLDTGSLILGDLKEVLGYGRTRAIPILEYLDDIGFTVRVEGGRVLRLEDNPPVKDGLNGQR